MKQVTAYRSDIDGLRALAVIPVLLFHAGVRGFTGGFVGVDIFFVISGFLITGIIWKAVTAGRFSVIEFYERRVRRIAPALLVVAFITSITAFFIMLPLDLRYFGKSVAAALVSVSNLTFLRESGYFQTDSELKPLLHTWSLGVEEQFYLFFPLMIALSARVSRRFAIAVVYAVLTLSFVGCVLWTRSHPTGAFFILPTRAWELMLGSVLALHGVRHIRLRPVREGLGIIGVLLILFAIVQFDSGTNFPGAAALLPCVGAAIIIATGPDSTVGRMLSLRPFVVVGLISYSLYLWHWPLLAFARYVVIRALAPLEIAAVLVASFVVAYASWRWVEQPFRGKNLLPMRRRLFGTAGAVAAVGVAFGAVLYVADGFPARVPAAVRAAAAGSADITADRDRCLSLRLTELQADRPCMLGDTVAPTIILWGDSHANAVSSVIDDVASAHHKGVIDAEHVTCPPLMNTEVLQQGASRECRAWNDEVLRLIQRRKVSTVILVARWANYAHGHGTGPDAYVTTSLGSDSRRAILDGLQSTLEALRGREVYLTMSVPEIEFDVPSATARALMLHRTVALAPSFSSHVARQRIIAKDLRALAERYHVKVLDPASILCSSTCRIAADGRPLYYDNHHLSKRGAAELAPLFEPVFADKTGAELQTIRAAIQFRMSR